MATTGADDGTRPRAAIVTGGGRAITLRLLRDSAVVVVGRSAADLDAVCADGHRAGGQALPCIGDVADPVIAAAVIDLVRSRGWALGHLVCNAGLGKGGPPRSSILPFGGTSSMSTCTAAST